MTPTRQREEAYLYASYSTPLPRSRGRQRPPPLCLCGVAPSPGAARGGADLPSHQATPRPLLCHPVPWEYGNLLGLRRRPGRRLAGAGLTAPRAGRTGKGRLSSVRGPPGCPARTSGPVLGHPYRRRPAPCPVVRPPARLRACLDGADGVSRAPPPLLSAVSGNPTSVVGGNSST
jgi:hypothetical protein